MNMNERHLYRFNSVDCLRGLTVLLMLVVNNPVDMRLTLPLLLHSDWQGYTIADGIFPCFLFIVGISVYLSKGCELKQSFRYILLRAVIIFLCGFFSKFVVFILFNFPEMKFMGVLQRIAVCYFFVAFANKYLGFTGLCISFVVATLLWTSLLVNWGDYRPFYNISDVLDNIVLSIHANRYDPVSQRYGDYEGLLSSIGAIATTLSGCVAGKILLTGQMKKLLLWGMGCFIAGLFMVYFINVPVIKKIWTPSFLLFSSAVGFGLIAITHYLFDIKNWPPVARSVGQHALAVYLVSTLSLYLLVANDLWLGLFDRGWARWAIPLMNLKYVALLFSVSVTLFWWGITAGFCRVHIREVCLGLLPEMSQDKEYKKQPPV